MIKFLTYYPWSYLLNISPFVALIISGKSRRYWQISGMYTDLTNFLTGWDQHVQCPAMVFLHRPIHPREKRLANSTCYLFSHIANLRTERNKLYCKLYRKIHILFVTNGMCESNMIFNSLITALEGSLRNGKKRCWRHNGDSRTITLKLNVPMLNWQIQHLLCSLH